jgi:hypothetical protein
MKTTYWFHESRILGFFQVCLRRGVEPGVGVARFGAAEERGVTVVTPTSSPTGAMFSAELRLRVARGTRLKTKQIDLFYFISVSCKVE